jgi:hypothetical protein
MVAQVSTSLPSLDLEAAALIGADDGGLEAKAPPEGVIAGVHRVEADGLSSSIGLLDDALDEGPATAR